MTIGQGIAEGGHNYLERMEKARQFDESLAEKRREADQQAFVSLANAPRARLDNSSEELAEKRRQFDESQKLKQQELDIRADQYDQAHSWDDALNQQRLDTLKAQQDAYAARMSHYQQLEEQTRQYAADLREERHNTDRDMCMLAYNNGGFITSPDVLEEFRGRFKANDLTSIANAGFFYNQDGTVKVKNEYHDQNGVLHPVNDDGKEPFFGYSFTYVDPQTGKVAVDPQTGKPIEKVRVPQGQTEWIRQFNDGTVSGYGRSGTRSSSGTSGGLDYEQTMARDAAKYDSYRFKNVLDAYKSNPQWQSLAMSDPKKAWQIIYDQAGMTQKEGGGTGGGSGTPAPTGAAAAIAQGRKGRSEGEDTPVKGAKPQVQTTTKQAPDNADDYDFGDATADSSTFRYSGNGMGEESISEDDYKKLTDEQRVSGKWQKTYARDGSPIWRRRVYGKRMKKEGAQTPALAAAQTEGGEGDKKEDHGGKKEEVKTITIPDSIKDDFKRNYPEATEKDIASGKYDVQIKNMAKRKGDAASSGEAEQRMKKRAVEQSQKAAKNFESGARQIDAEYESELDEARKEIEREADSSGRDQKWIEVEYASQKRKIDALYKNKRMKYNQQYGAY